MKTIDNGNDSQTYIFEPGDDYMIDLKGNDIYVCNKGVGAVIADDTAGSNVVKFGEGIKPEDIEITLSNDWDGAILPLVMSIKGTSDSFTFTGGATLDRCEFADGTVLKFNDILKRVYYLGDKGNDYLYDGYNHNGYDILNYNMLGGNDYVKGAAGDNSYKMGTGNDTTVDMTGNDTYYFNAGDGKDSIQDIGGTDKIIFGAGITQDKLEFSKDGNNLLINIKDSSDQITVKDWITSNDNKIESVVLCDGTVITSDQIDKIINGGGNHAPKAGLTSGKTNEDTAVTLDVLAEATDEDGDTLSIASFTQGSHGSISVKDNKLVYTPDADYNGSDSFEYTISDGNGGTATQTVKLTVKPVNDPPKTGLTSGTTNEDTAVVLDVLAKATDVDGDILSIASFTQGTHGSISKKDNKLVYTPDANYNGNDSFEYTISDGNGGTVTQTVKLTVKPVNDPPKAGLTSGTTNEDTAVTLDVLAKATDADGDTLSIASFTQGTHGSISKKDNKLVYTPTANYNGSDSFSYTISDGNGGTVTQTVKLTVKPVNDPPKAGLTSGTTNEDTAVTLDVLAKATDVDGDTLSIASFTQGTHGSISKKDNKLVYTPDANYNGNDSFNYTISDGNGGTVTQTVKLTVKPVNDPPTAGLTSGTTKEDTAVTLDVLAQATDVDGDTLSIASFTQGSHGSISKKDNKLVYTPDADYNGADSFNYTISDGNGGSVTQTVKLTINPAGSNHAPVAGLTSGTTKEDTAVTLDVLAEATDEDGDTLSIASFTQGSHGSISVKDNKLVYTPDADYNGSDNFSYTISDGNGGTATQTVKLAVKPVNDPPKAGLTSGATNEDTAVVLDVLAKATDIDGDTLSIASFTQGSHGSISVKDNKLVYTPDVDYNGSDSFNYTISDGNGGTATQTVKLTVKPVNDPPKAGLTSGTTNEDTAVVLDVLAKATDVDGDTLSIASFTQGTHGNISVKDNKLVYTPDADYNGSDSFNYTISDGNGGTATQTVKLTVKPVNDPPKAGLTSGTTNEDTAVVLDVLAKATDVDGDTLSIASFTQGSHGSISVKDNKLVYTPDADYNGSDSFNYTISDGNGGTVTQTVKLTVKPVNDAPVVSKNIDDITYDISKAINFSVASNFTDVDGDTLTYKACLENGTALPSWVTFDPDTKTFKIDGSNSDQKTLSIKVTVSDGSLSASDVFTIKPNNTGGDDSDNYLRGTNGNDILYSYGGNDTINGLAGADTMVGGTGNDIYYVDNKGDLIVENCNEGTDLVYSSINYNLGCNVENLTLTGSAKNGTGNNLDNIIKGNSGNNVLNGADGDDLLIGNAGNDTLNGGTGADTMIGGTGNDTYYVDLTTDVIKELYNQGTDTVISGGSYVLGDNLENLTLTGSLDISGTGNELDNVIIGNKGNNTLRGLDGNDTLNGGIGADTMRGGTGNDTYYVDNSGDTIVEWSNEGIDTVISSISYTLDYSLENLTLTGKSSINGTGNAYDNVIIGNSGNNILSGGAGDDTYTFGLNSGHDTVNDASGTDEIYFKCDVDKSNIAMYLDCSKNLFIDYGTSEGTDVVKVQNQCKNTVEKVELDNGLYMTNDDINKLIQDMTAFAKSHNIQMTNVSDVRSNQDLMNLVAAAWHS